MHSLRDGKYVLTSQDSPACCGHSSHDCVMSSRSNRKCGLWRCTHMCTLLPGLVYHRIIHQVKCCVRYVTAMEQFIFEHCRSKLYVCTYIANQTYKQHPSVFFRCYIQWLAFDYTSTITWSFRQWKIDTASRNVCKFKGK